MFYLFSESLFRHFLYYFRWISTESVISVCASMVKSCLFFSTFFISIPPTNQPVSTVQKPKAVMSFRRKV
ncbi:hypothetical protein HanPSC8_Chr02g0059351 [Helianthus annuus]|nr:hypothetical protein HanPSC8_Chr02g0059351 [Helianthus annuus]